MKLVLATLTITLSVLLAYQDKQISDLEHELSKSQETIQYLENEVDEWEELFYTIDTQGDAGADENYIP